MQQNILSGLQPAALWQYFEQLNAVPRASKKEARVIKFITDFAAAQNLSHEVDAVGNVLVRKPATKGMEQASTIVLQSHLDMVHQKNADTDFDFDTQGINMFIDGDWVKAKGTTLGADNGIGVAAIMALLASNDIPHPALEALFTIDEETGMTGAIGLQGGKLTGKYLLNLDTEEDTDLTIGCAGGLDVSASGTYAETTTTSSKALLVAVLGLTGGHSGGDIHLGRGNANKLLTRLLWACLQQNDFELVSMNGGSLRNAIPREASAVLQTENVQALEANLRAAFEQFKTAFSSTDPHLRLSIEPTEATEKVVEKSFTKRWLQALYACPNGIYRMSPDVPNLVESSNNLARIQLQNGNFSIQCLTRSSVESEKQDLANALSAAFSIVDAQVRFDNGYPGWAPKPDSNLVRTTAETYQELFGEAAHVNAVHAGLECGILGSNYPDMQMISFGPNIFGAHSPDERVQISSVQKFWKLLCRVLQALG